MFIKKVILKLLNLITPKSEKCLYFEPLKNCKNDNYDIINFTGDSLLSFLNYYVNINNTRKKVYLVIYHKERIALYKQYVKKYNNIKFVFLLSELYESKKIKLKLLKLFAMFKSKYLFFEPIYVDKLFLTKSQNCVSLTYFSSFKSDLGLIPFENTLKRWKLICATSKMDAVFKAAAYGVPYERIKTVGLPRNDYLLLENNKREEIFNWIEKKTSLHNPKIILYSPTYRDYESQLQEVNRSIWGFDIDNEIQKYLEDNNCVAIVKLHSWQNKGIRDKKSKNVLLYEDNFDFSFYDLMKESALLISDYSSIVLDYLLLDKPLIFNLYDIEEYLKCRGFSYEPYEDFCPGLVVKDAKSFLNAIDESLTTDPTKLKRKKIKAVTHENYCGKACKEIYDYLFLKRINKSNLLRS